MSPRGIGAIGPNVTPEFPPTNAELIKWLRSLRSNLNTVGCWHIPITETELAQLAAALEAAEQRYAELDAANEENCALVSKCMERIAALDTAKEGS